MSSAQKELAAERRSRRTTSRAIPFCGRFFDVFLFEDLPASGRRADAVYPKRWTAATSILACWATSTATKTPRAVSPTEREFDRATAAGKERLIFVKGDSDSARHPKMQALVARPGGS